MLIACLLYIYTLHTTAAKDYYLPLFFTPIYTERSEG